MRTLVHVDDTLMPMRALTVVTQCLRLYRPDVALISFFAFQAGVILSGRHPDVQAFAFGAVISGCSMNFVYSINSYMDRHVDAINKPHRPLASGALSLPVASRYCRTILLLALLLPLGLTRHPLVLGLSWLLPLLGWLYSCPPFMVRRRKLPSLLLIALAHHLPALIGFYLQQPDLPPPPHLFGLTFLFAMAVIPLKDLQDQRGDIAFAIENWAASLGVRPLILRSLFILLVNVLLIAMVPLAHQTRPFLLLLHATIIGWLGWALARPAFAQVVYARLLQSIGAVFLAFVLFRSFPH